MNDLDTPTSERAYKRHATLKAQAAMRLITCVALVGRTRLKAWTNYATSCSQSVKDG